MASVPTRLLLRGGPDDGLRLTSPVDLHTDALATVRHNGYVYRDSGRSYREMRVFDWLPLSG